MSNTATIPEGLEVLAVAGNSTIRRRWFSAKAIPLLFFAIFWDGFILFWYWTVLTRVKTPNLVALLFPIIHVGVGVVLTYSALALLFNKTEVTVTGAKVRVATGPMRWPGGNKIVSSSDIVALLIRSRWENRQMSFVVMYADRQRREHKLVTGLPQNEQAEFIAAAIRERLRLKPVAEQMAQ